jgi:DNA polymerase III delta prime subunit
MNHIHSVWTEKYRPLTIAECILPKATASEFTGFIKLGKIPNILLAGPAGTGKTTAALALCRELGYDHIVINGSNEGRLIDTLRTKITNFASSVSLDGSRKCVILDEADYIPAEIQAALRGFMEEFASNCSFILTCNFPNRIMEAIHSRCAVIDFTIPKAERQTLIIELFKRISMILDTEGVTYDKRALVTMVGKFFPDMRRLLNELQRKGTDGIDAGSLEGAVESDLAELVKHLKGKNFRDVRKWVATTPNLDIAYIARQLYDNMYELCVHEDMPNLIMLLAEYQYKNAFVADKEINIMAMLVEIMAAVRFK